MVQSDGPLRAGAGGELHEPRTSVLVAQAQRGDAAALERLVERYLGSLTGFCRRLAGARDGAQDVI